MTATQHDDTPAPAERVAHREEIRYAERAVIGSCLLAPDTAVREVLETLNPEDFYDARLGALYALIATMYGEGTPIDTISLHDAILREGGAVRSITAIDLHTLVAQTPTAANVGYYIRKVKDDAGNRALDAFGTRCRQLAQGGDAFTENMRNARDHWAALTTATSGDLQSRSLAELLDGPVEYDWLIPDLLERQDRLILTGGEGAGKSTFVRQVAICAAAGIHPTTFRSMDPIRVLVVDAENSERQWRRKATGLVAKARQVGRRNPGDHMHVVTMNDIPGGRLDIVQEKHLGAVHRLIDQHDPELLIIGPIYRLSSKAINSDDDAAPFLAALDSLRSRGPAMVMEAHAGHGKEMGGERDMRPRGSSAFLGWPEFGFGLSVDRSALAGLGPTEKPSIFNLVRWRGDRDERAWPDKLVRGGEWPWTDERRAQGIGPAWAPSWAGTR